MSSSNSSANSSFADVVRHSVETVKTVKTVKIVKVEKFSPVKANRVRSVITSTPTFKRKRAEIESFSPVLDKNQVQRVKEETVDKQNLKFTVRRRKLNSVNKHRRFLSAKKVPISSSTSTQTEEDSLIQIYIEKAKDEYFAKFTAALSLQIEKEKGFALRTALVSILERAEIALDHAEACTFNLNESMAATKNPDLLNPAGLKSYHDQVSRAVKTKSSIHNGLLSSLKSIKKECNSVFVDLKNRTKEANQRKHPWSAATGSMRPLSQSSSSVSSQNCFTNSILTSKRVPFDPNVKFSAPSKSVQFRVPLNEFLSQSEHSPNVSVNISSDKIEIEIPQVSQPSKVLVKREFQPCGSFDQTKDVDLSLLNISQENTDDEWCRFASTKHKIEDGDVGSLLNYSENDDEV